MTCTPKQQEIVKTTHAKIAGAFKGAVEEAIIQLLTKHPEWCEKFSWFQKGTAIEAHRTMPNFQSHITTLSATISKSFSHCDNIASVKADLKKGDAQHKVKVIGKAQFDALEPIMMNIVGGALGGDWNAETKEAWAAAYAQMVDCMEH